MTCYIHPECDSDKTCEYLKDCFKYVFRGDCPFEEERVVWKPSSIKFTSQELGEVFSKLMSEYPKEYPDEAAVAERLQLPEDYIKYCISRFRTKKAINSS